MKIKRLLLSVLLSTTLIINLNHVAYGKTIDSVAAGFKDNDASTASSDNDSSDTASSGQNTDTDNTSSLGNENTIGADSEKDWPEAPAISAGSAILIDADTCTVLYDKNSNVKGYPASITKLMTAILTIENCSLNELVTFSRDCVNSVTWEDAQIPVAEGEQYTVENCLYSILLPSANDVAYGLGEHIAGSVPAFAQMMTERAAQLGAKNTHFTNASGLSDPNHYTTAYDIAMFSRAVMNNPTLIEIMNTTKYVLPPTNKFGYERTIRQRHQLLINSEYYYEYAVGGKTGFTDESKYTLCTFATKGDMNLIAVVLLCETPEDRFKDTIALFNYGFENFEKLTLNSSNTSKLLENSNYYHSNVFGGEDVTFNLASSAVTVPLQTKSDEIEMIISRENSGEDRFADVTFKYGDIVVGNSSIVLSTINTAASSLKPGNLPFLPEKEVVTYEVKDYIVINAYHIIYAVCGFLFLTVILLGLIFMNYSEYGKEVIKTRKRRRSYRRRKLRW